MIPPIHAPVLLVFVPGFLRRRESYIRKARHRRHALPSFGKLIVRAASIPAEL
jgi:hypothetical protein